MKLLSVSMLAVSAVAYKIGVISDIHTNPLYDATIDDKDECWSTGTNLAKKPMALARYGCDPSPEFIDMIFQRFNESFGEMDVILLTGDMVGHDMDPERDEFS